MVQPELAPNPWWHDFFVKGEVRNGSKFLMVDHQTFTPNPFGCAHENSHFHTQGMDVPSNGIYLGIRPCPYSRALYVLPTRKPKD